LILLSNEAEVLLKPGREKSLLRRHPWVFSGAIARTRADPGSGDEVRVRAHDGRFLGWGAFNPHSQIAVRIWSFDPDHRFDADLLRARLEQAIALRRALLPDVEAVRLVHGESDALPGLIVDRYADSLVLQASSAGAARWKAHVADMLLSLTGCVRVHERSDADVMALEGLDPASGPLRGDAAPAVVEVREGALALGVDLAGGHKTGFYLDQRDNRALVRTLAQGRTVLDCFCYSGGFTLNALAGGAHHVTAVDASSDALAGARENLARNALDPARVEWVEGDVFQYLRRLRDQDRRFGLIVLDPPKFAPTAAHAERAARGYKDINLLAFKLLQPGGLLATFSCSGGISRDLFQKIVAGAASDAGVEARIVRWLSAAPDHPVALSFPEGEYLKGLLCAVAQ